MMKTSWRRGVVALALSAALSVAVSPAYAAGESSSNIVGSVDAGAGYSVTVKNAATGLSREMTTDSSGSFRFSQLPVGEYEVIVSKGGTIVGKESVRLGLGGNATANFEVGAREGAEVIEVVGARPSAVDLSQTDSGLVIGETAIDAMPVARNLTAVALLAPGTIGGEARFGNLASFGGSSVAENSCYINGLEVTDTRQGLGCGSVPFEFYKEFQVKTGGYSAQFGRTTGGVINTVTKSGTNEWDFAFTAALTPGGLQESAGVSRATSGNPPQTIITDENGVDHIVTLGTGRLNEFRDFRHDSFDLKEYTLSASGPIIEDKLFIYAILNPRDIEAVSSAVAATTSGFPRTASNQMNYDSASGADNLFWGAKLDWDITDDHRLSYFAYSDRRDIQRDIYNYNPTTQAITPNAITRVPDGLVLQRGGEAESFNYVGHITDDITISALYGTLESQFYNEPTNITCPLISDTRPVSPANLIVGCGPGTPKGSNFDDNEQIRFDVEWAIGDHVLRVGLDQQDRQSEQTSFPIAGANYTYGRLNSGDVIQLDNGAYTHSGAALDFVARRAFTGGGGFSSEMEAYYIEDSWQITDELMVMVGGRWDSLTNYGTSGIAFADFQDEFAPRVAASWDPVGDGKSKVTFNWGRYFLPIPNNTNYRVASGISDSTQYLTYTGTDPELGTPIGSTPITGSLADSTATNSRPAFPSKDVFQAEEATPFYKEEWIVGYEVALTDEYKASVRGIYRDTPSALDDYCGDLTDWCIILNPGEGGTWSQDNNFDGVADPDSRRYYSAAEIGLPKAKNSYEALQLQLDHNSSDLRWSFLYTWSRSYGNFEGAVKSDIAQPDAGITQDFDFPALMDGANGLQANDRTHVFKFYGSYAITDQWTAGWNSSLSSGRPLSTFGRGYPDTSAHIFGSYGDTFYIRTGCPDTNGNNECDQGEKQWQRTSRGDAGRTPWIFQLDVSTDYTFNLADIDMKLSLDVFNLFNIQEVLTVDEHYTTTTESTRNVFYGSPMTYQAPRSVRLGFEARF